MKKRSHIRSAAGHAGTKRPARAQAVGEGAVTTQRDMDHLRAMQDKWKQFSPGKSNRKPSPLSAAIDAVLATHGAETSALEVLRRLTEAGDPVQEVDDRYVYWRGRRGEKRTTLARFPTLVSERRRLARQK